MKEKRVQACFEYARESYAEFGVDVDSAMTKADAVPISLHCWQGDDVGGFEKPDASLEGGGIQVTGNYPGKAGTLEELRDDISEAYAVIPGQMRLSLHASYADFKGKPVERDEIEPGHFLSWVDWAKSKKLGLDFNATLFSHPLAADGYTLSSTDQKTRKFWIRHTQNARKIAAYFGRQLRKPCVHNLWIPDGAKDLTVDRMRRRSLLLESLDTIYSESYPEKELLDALEGKLFGIGSESFVVGSHEFYLCYALSRKKLITLDMGHYHPTESVADKISSILPFGLDILLHVSRGVRWDSDHVVILNDDLRELCLEIARAQAMSRVHIGLDFFDGTINRVGAWAIGARSTRKALLLALLEPKKTLADAEAKKDGFARLAALEEAKSLPWGAVWDRYCLDSGVPTDSDLVSKLQDYECRVLGKRG
jgi:L-rhamnose isomerase